MDARTWFIAGTLPLMAGGLAHAVAAAVDAVRPTFFAPADPGALPAMERSGMRLRRGFPGGDHARPSLWDTWLGIHISHGVGIFTFGLLCLLIAAHDFALVAGIAGLQPLTIAFAAVYLALSLRFWFYGPVLLTGTSTFCFTVAALA